jgi:hypothetical protein
MNPTSVTGAKLARVGVAGEGFGLDAAPHVAGRERVLGVACDALGSEDERQVLALVAGMCADDWLCVDGEGEGDPLGVRGLDGCTASQADADMAGGRVT